jgi:hypothetical protein
MKKLFLISFSILALSQAGYCANWEGKCPSAAQLEDHFKTFNANLQIAGKNTGEIEVQLFKKAQFFSTAYGIGFACTYVLGIFNWEHRARDFVIGVNVPPEYSVKTCKFKNGTSWNNPCESENPEECSFTCEARK